MTRGATERPVVIEVRGLEKSFRIPEHRVDSLKERATIRCAGHVPRAPRAARDVSFDVRQGEFFGIVGRNGSGKSTLLKIMSSIYRADAGRIRMAGRLAPFIELGVGFNPELTSRENVVLNGVMMGLGRREARRRLDAVLEFAELAEFADLKLKNYSSGMMVRLAFAVMVQADADIMLIDEVLAVGDAAFAQKCMDVFRERRRAGKTLVLVTHDMATVQTLCDRAMLIDDGELRYIGEPEETALRYYRMNFARRRAAGGRRPAASRDVNARVVHAGLEGRASRSRTSSRACRSWSTSCSRRRARSTARSFSFHLRQRAGTWCSASPRRLEERVGRAGARVRHGGPDREPAACPGATRRRLHPRGRHQGHMTRAGAPAAATSSSTARRRPARHGRAAGRDRAGAGGGRVSDAPAELRDVAGPSALGGGWRRALELLYLIAATDFKQHYFGTALGYLWSIARPLMLFGVLLAVFTQVFRLGSDVPHYPVLLLLNIVLFGFFQEATGAAVTSIVVQEGVVRKTQFPRLVIPLAVVLTSLFNLGLNLVVVFVFILAFGVTPAWTWLLLPVLVAALIVITTAVSMIVSSLFPRFRDLAIIWSVLSTVLFYASPVLYPIDKVPGTLRDVILVNPLAPLLELARKWILDPDAPGPGERRRRLAGAAAGGRDLRRDLRAGGLAVRPRGAADRRGALRSWGSAPAARSRSWRC